MAEPLGLEPRLRAPKTLVLPITPWFNGTTNGTRTRVYTLKGCRPDRLDDGGICAFLTGPAQTGSEVPKTLPEDFIFRV